MGRADHQRAARCGRRTLPLCPPPSKPQQLTPRRQIVAFLVGFMAQDIKLSLYIGLAGTVLTFAVVVPPWPFYNKNPEPWLPPHAATSGFQSIQVDGQKVG